MTQENYPGILVRVKAMVTDSVVIVGFMFIITFIFSLFDNVPDNARILAFVFIFILYDPVFTSSFGGTIGHFILGIRVKREANENKNILFPWAVLRFFLKAFLGIISLLTISGSKKRKAIHDFFSGSIVIYETDLNRE